MNKEQFDIIWRTFYPETVPISHYFKDNYSDRWFRIHSLPDSKRYAENEQELKFLLERQKQIITDLIGDKAQVLIVTGEFNWGERQGFITEEEKVFADYNFIRLDNIDLFELNPEDYDEGEIYRPAFAETFWSDKNHDKLLTAIAEDKIRAFFISIDKQTLIAPYDGGIDFILRDRETKEQYKQKYKGWLSIRMEGY